MWGSGGEGRMMQGGASGRTCSRIEISVLTAGVAFIHVAVLPPCREFSCEHGTGLPLLPPILRP